MDRAEYEKAARYWTDRDAAAKKMDRAALLEQIDAFLNAHNTCALATGSGSFVRCTPIEYTWHDGKLWLLSEGGLKFRALVDNANVCAAVFEPYKGFGALDGLQLTGTAEIIEPGTPDYLALLAYKKIPAAALQKLDHPLYLLRITPKTIDFLSSSCKKQGFSSRQTLSFD